MAETAAGLAGSSPSSLIILDELGRGTATHDGYAVAYAVLAHLGQTTGAFLLLLNGFWRCVSDHWLPKQPQQFSHFHTTHPLSDTLAVFLAAGARTLFTTHYHSLCSEPLILPHVSLAHMAHTITEDGQFMPLHTLRNGPAPEGSSGIQVAGTCFSIVLFPISKLAPVA